MNSKIYDRILLALLFIMISQYILNLGTISLWDPDEPYYIEAAREMREKGDLITPYFNYEQRLNKPVLFYWLVIGSSSVFGYNEFAARFPSLLAGLGVIFLTYRLAKDIFGRSEGLLSALIASTMLEIFVLSRQSVTDMPLSFFLMLALYGYFTTILPSCRNRWYLMYAGVGFAVLIKGPVGIVLPGAIIFFFILIRRDWSSLKTLKIPQGILIFLIISVPWYLVVLIKEGYEFFRVFIIENNLLRFVTPMYKHTGPVYYYIPVILLGAFPWAVISIIYLYKSAKTAISKINKEHIEGETAGKVFLLLWILIIFLFFSISGSKLPAYILGLFPPLAILTASGITGYREKLGRTALIVHSIYVFLFLIIFLMLIRFSFLESFSIIIIVLVLICGIAVSIYMKFRKSDLLNGNIATVLSTSALMVIFAIAVNIVFFPRIENFKPIKKLAAIASASREIESRYIAYKCYKPSMIFYNRHNFTDPENLIELHLEMDIHSPAFVYMKDDDWKALPEDVKARFKISGRSPTYRDRLKKLEDLFNDDISNLPEMLLLYYKPD